MIKRHIFIIGFGGSLLTFAAINIAIYLSVRDCCRSSGSGFMSDSIAIGGFPFPWYSNGTFVEPNLDWSAVVANIVIAVMASFAIGRIVKRVFVKPNPSWPGDSLVNKVF